MRCQRRIAAGILRGEWHYEGFVVTDWGDFDEIPHAADEMRAGNDMIMSGYHTRYKIPDQIYQNVVKSYSGQPHTVSLDQLRRNAAHVLNTILFSRNAFNEDGDYNLEKHIQNKLEVMTTQLPAAIVGMDYAKIKANPIVASGSEGANRYTFSIAAAGDPLPASLSLHGNGFITGIPAPEDMGNYNLLVRVEDDRGNMATKPLELEVANQKEKVKDQENDETTKAAPLPVDRGLMLDPPDNSELKATISKAFSRRITASGGTVESFSYTLSPKGDALPKGLTFQDGLISGKPEPGTAGVYAIVVRASEIGGSFRSSEAGYRLVVSE
ncbi:MAG: putative Ig domain-containing protein [Lewinellaceae bacterium]|nr:putative Ig domain-containing protein [Lewinellaceae bacterium]